MIGHPGQFDGIVRIMVVPGAFAVARIGGKPRGGMVA